MHLRHVLLVFVVGLALSVAGTLMELYAWSGGALVVAVGNVVVLAGGLLGVWVWWRRR